MTTARDEHTATALAGGRVLIAGGYSASSGNGSDPSKALSSAELYDPTTGRFSTTGSMTQIRWWGHTATRLLDGRVLITGGWGSNTLNLATADVYNPSTGTFAATDAMTASRYGATATLLSGGRVLIAGGSDGNTVFASAELYQP
jgi:N-acetylneuraminic acid mutarotase